MERGGDDLQDDLVIDESVASSEEDESCHFIPGIGRDSEGDRAASFSTASLLAKKRKGKAKDKERKAKVCLCGEYISYTDRL